MPPSIKVSETQIIEAAVKIVREKGESALNARELARELGCSTRPIFRVYGAMSDLKEVVLQEAGKIFQEVMSLSMRKENSILSLGLATVHFAKDEPNLFKLFFMSNFLKYQSLYEMVDQNNDYGGIDALIKMTGLPAQPSKKMFISLWMIAHGIASMIATNPFAVSDDEITELLVNAYDGFLRVYKEKSTEGVDKYE
ncbi:MAG: TetR-like C-terminal domain-containing protein [Lachnospiraceae bacterium]|nr:TetR-like C-terminal domain-containing protein [Lachnospiraceae bacterium]